MNNSKKPAFPVPYSQCKQEEGMTKREWFAGMALQGIIASRSNAYHSGNDIEQAVKIADGLLAKLAETK